MFFVCTSNIITGKCYCFVKDKIYKGEAIEDKTYSLMGECGMFHYYDQQHMEAIFVQVVSLGSSQVV